jgi:hypothetical protein
MRQFDADGWLTAYTTDMGARPLQSVREKGLALAHELVGLCRFTVLVLLTSHFHHSQCPRVKGPPSCAMRTTCAGHRRRKLPVSWPQCQSRGNGATSPPKISPSAGRPAPA